MNTIHEFSDVSAEPAVRGFLHEPAQPNGDALVLTHGAGANCQSKLLTAVANAFADAGYLVLRCDLPFRQSRPHGPPFPAMAARDREGLRRAVEVLRVKTSGRIFLGGHSYGGRQASMLAAEQPQLAAGLLLLSYPLHPPRKPSGAAHRALSSTQHACAVCSRLARSLWLARGDEIGAGLDRPREDIAA